MSTTQEILQKLDELRSDWKRYPHRRVIIEHQAKMLKLGLTKQSTLNADFAHRVREALT